MTNKNIYRDFKQYLVYAKIKIEAIYIYNGTHVTYILDGITKFGLID